MRKIKLTKVKTLLLCMVLAVACASMNINAFAATNTKTKTTASKVTTSIKTSASTILPSLGKTSTGATTKGTVQTMGIVVVNDGTGVPKDIGPYPGYLLQYNPSHYDYNVYKLQVGLQRVGVAMDSGPDSSIWVSADGYYGVHTESAVQYFQYLWGLQQDGICGYNTWTTLRNFLLYHT